MQKVYDGLDTFREKAGLQKHLGNLVYNLKLELDEVKESYISNNIYHLIEEVCDICVYAYNGIHQVGGSYGDIALCKVPSRYSDFYAKVSVYIELIDSQSIEIEQGLKFIIEFASDFIKTQGFDFELCMIEVVRKINSRQGAINQVTQKWEKDANQDKRELYKPDFSKCELDVSIAI